MNFTKHDILLGKGFTAGQATAIIKLEDFYKSDETIFTLCGAAGTGKTFVIKYLLDNIIKHNVCVTAPTHKAVRVIEKLVFRKGKTLQSLLGLRLNVNLEMFNIDKVKFDTLGEPNIRNYHIVIIDEGSMINDSLLRLLMLQSKQFNTKLVILGDKLQLPPVGERSSKVFEVPNIVELTDIVRQKNDNPLLDLLLLLRSDIVHQTSTFINYIQKNKEHFNTNGEGYKVVKEAEFTQLLLEQFNDERLTKNIDLVRFTSWTNATVRKFNKIIRNGILTDAEHIVSHDDIFTGYTTIVDDYYKPIIINSDDYIVDGIEQRTSDYKFELFLVNLRSISGYSSTVQIVDHTHKSWINYYNILNNLHFNAFYANASERGKKFRKYYEFKNRYLTMLDIPLKDKGNVKPRGTVPKDIDYAYALTTHKSQGSTYENVYVDLNDTIYGNTKDGNKYLIYNTDRNPYAIEFRNKLLYVALSRASKKAIILY
jgi:exodeoxyribonuclease-5